MGSHRRFHPASQLSGQRQYSRSADRLWTRSGLTLIELLVVIGIMLLLTTIALGVFATDKYQRQVRESSRSLTALIQGARDLAISNGRPVGILIDQSIATTSVVTMGRSVSVVTVPPPYTGDLLESRAIVRYFDNNSPHNRADDRYLLIGLGAVNQNNPDQILPNAQDELWFGRVRVGDTIKLGDIPHLFRIAKDNLAYGSVLAADSFPWELQAFYDSTPTSSGTRSKILSNGSRVIDPNSGDPVGQVSFPLQSPPLGYQYKINLQPIPIPNRSIDFPETVCVDLLGSGWGSGNQFSGDNGGIGILFGPTGSVERVTAPGYDGPVNAPIYLLLGKIDQATPPVPRANWVDADNLWVAIEPMTGRVTSQPVVEHPNLAQSRILTRSISDLGGR